MISELRDRISEYYDRPLERLHRERGLEVFESFRRELEHGSIRAAERDGQGEWHANAWVKKGILLGFRLGTLDDFSSGPFRFFDCDTFPPRGTELSDNVRIVPGGSAIRAGAYVAPRVVCMPPMYINVGAYVDEGTMIDSHALVGSCAQIGTHVHISAAAQIGGVLEPPQSLPVVIEEDVFVGGGCGVYEGCIVRRSAVLAPGVILTGSTPVYDLVYSRVIAREGDSPLEIPAAAVVVPGGLHRDSSFARHHGISTYVPVIVKYRDESTDVSTELEDALR
jgi:2,3,4,5-tetrahydropyridine-2-carboxylate N-succinyltransferase